MKNAIIKLAVIMSIVLPATGTANLQKCSKIKLQKIQEHPLESLQLHLLDDKSYIVKRLALLADIEVTLRKDMICLTTEELESLIEKQNIQAVEDLKKIMKKHLWITIPEFGEKASENAWIIVQHAEHDIEFQHKVLFLMEYFLSKGKINPYHYASLYDRISHRYLDFGIKQKYGTQAYFNEKKATWELLPFEGDVKELNDRRKKLGLKSGPDEEINVIQ